MIKLEDVNNEIYFHWRRSQIDALGTERLGHIHVSDIIKPCMRNVIYKKTEPSTGVSTEDIKSLWFGQIVHSNSMMAEPEHHEKFLAYDYVRDEALTYSEALEIPVDDPRQMDIIYGSIDDLIKVGDKWVICDKKTTGSIDYFSKARSSASDSHKDQINRYRVLLKKCYDIDADYGCVVYVSNRIEKDSRDKPAVISFKLQPIEETLEDMIRKSREIKESLTDRTLPERTKCFLCDGMCPYATKCFTDNRVSLDDK
jgi:CRISPR/Cas system-associated exonuclease Cas4 (RecB family)